MSLLLRAAACLVLVSGLAACSGGGAPASRGVPPGAASPASPGAGDDPGPTACDEVNAGIAAFNRGEFDETVASFQRALPLAEAEDEAAGTRRSAELLEAVRYYATLPADEYLAASMGSAAFATYKAITLGQCGGAPPGPGEPDGGGGVLA